MLFNSQYFVIFFLPIFICIYFGLSRVNRRVMVWALIIASIIFYLPFGIRDVLLLSASLVFNWIAGFVISKYRNTAVLLVSVTVNVIGLLFFKYGGNGNLLLPIGISFYTFQQISFLVSVYRGNTGFKIEEYLAYILFFPKLLMGPLTEYDDFLNCVRNEDLRKIRYCNIANGILLFIQGLSKKVLIADVCARGVDWGITNHVSATRTELLVTMLLYTFQIYFDFSGYSDMARGIAKMLNIELPINFDNPYRAVSIIDFWKRWHITLTSFLTRYVYYPIGGNRKGKTRTYINILIVFLVSGIWHGSNLTFILWGVLHGVLNVLERVTKKHLERIPRMIRWMATFILINILWLLFRADSIEQWVLILRSIVFENPNHGLLTESMINAVILPWLLTQGHTGLKLIKLIMMLLWLAGCIVLSIIPDGNKEKPITGYTAIAGAVLFVVCFAFMGRESVFIYSGF